MLWDERRRASSPDNAPVCSGKETHENRNSEGSPLKCKSSKVSSGFMGILMAVQLCAEVCASADEMRALGRSIATTLQIASCKRMVRSVEVVL